MKSSKWAIVLVLLLVVAVLIVKQTRQNQKPRPTASRPAAAAAPGSQSEPSNSPAASEGQTAEEKTGESAQSDGPLSGADLDACLKSGLPTMADFGRGTCHACQQMAPVLEQAARDYRGRANIVFVELDKYPELGRKYNIRLMPTQVFFDKSGSVVNSHVGGLTREGVDYYLKSLGVDQ